MDIRFVILFIMMIVLIGWVIFCGVQFVRSGRQIIVDANLKTRVKCEKCQMEYEVSKEELSRSGMSKSQSVTKTELHHGILVRRRRYLYYAKKFRCPHCGKRRYAQILNLEELQAMTSPAALRTGLRWLVIMCIGGFIILILFGIPMNLAEQRHENRVEEMRQQRVEELLEEFNK